MKFAILTDIHLGPEGYYKGLLRRVSKNVEIFLDEFVDEMNNIVKPDFVVILGDLINDVDEATDKKNINYIVNLLKKIKCPIHFVTGNHDLKNISEDELTALFNQKKLYYSFDSNEFHFIVLFSKVAEDRTIRISDKQKEWLKQDLDKTNKKTIIFTHHGLADQDLIGNPWFEGRPENCLIANREEIRNIFSTSDKVIASFNSHLHWDKQDIHNNIPYFTIQSLTENENNKGIASEAHAVIDIINNKIDVEIKGNYPKNFSHQK